MAWSCKEPDKNLRIGRIIEVDGLHVKAELDESVDELSRVYNNEVYSIGQFGSTLKTYFGDKVLFLFVTRLRLKSEIEAERGHMISPDEDSRVLEADLFGEGTWTRTGGGGKLTFERGISTYPLPMQDIYLTTPAEMQSIYESDRSSSLQLGTYVGAGSIPCYVGIDDMLCRHMAILGSTGSGKSSAVTVIIRALSDYKVEPGQSQNWHPYIIILDPHNEYKQAFPQAERLVSDENTLSLPYWLLNFQELSDLFIGKTEHQATSQTNILKEALLEGRKEGAAAIGMEPKAISIDSPIPFSLEKVIQRIKTAADALTASKQDKHQSILGKIDLLKRDSRLGFIMKEWSSGLDEIQDIMAQFLSPEKSIKVIDLSGIPNDVAGVVSSTVARLLFMYKLWETPEERGRDPILLVCEEAHRYVPNKGEAEYAAAQDAIKRVAKEGRKYGISLLLVSQRPSEVESTVLSQCNTWLVLRLTNTDDQSHVLRFLPDSLLGMARMLPALRRREAVFIGQAAPFPSRIMMTELENSQLPRSQDVSFINGWAAAPITKDMLTQVAFKWRTQLRGAFEGASKPDTESGE